MYDNVDVKPLTRNYTWRPHHENALPRPPDALEEVGHDEGQDHGLLQQGFSFLQAWGDRVVNHGKFQKQLFKLEQNAKRFRVTYKKICAKKLIK